MGLALAGGGPAGAVYEIGALRALEEATEGLDLNDLDVYVGVSAGSLIASLLANGITVAQLVRELVEGDPEDPLLPGIFFSFAVKEWWRRGIQLPRLAAEASWRFLRHPNPFRWIGYVSRALPVALYDNEPLRRALRHIFTRDGRTDDFRTLDRCLVVVATDLGAGEPIRFGTPGFDAVPISTAVQASTALPGLYPPVEIDGRFCVDGVLLKTVHASVAFDAGAELLFCVNPIVPVDTSAGIAQGALPRGTLVKGGLPTILSQTFRTLVHSRLQAGFAAYGDRYEGAEFILLEPERDEYQMFFSNIFTLSSRRAICELAYGATRRTLLHRASELIPIFARHGITLRTDVLEDPARNVWAGVGARPRDPRRRPSTTERLAGVLDRLDRVVGD